MKTKTKVAASVTPVALAAALVTFIALYSPSNFDGKVDCIYQAQIGELVILEATPASAYQWQVLPDNDNYKIVNGGKTLIFSAQEIGDYIFVCAMASDNDVKLVVHKVIVTIFSVNLKSLVKRWLPSNYDKDIASKLSRAFRDSTEDAENIDDLIKNSSECNRKALGDNLEQWKPFLINFSNYCKTNLEGKSFDEHISIWIEVSKALALASKSA